MEASFNPDIVDHMIKVPDAASLAAMTVLARMLGRRPGGSTGTAFYGVLELARDMVAVGHSGSIVTLICDSGERYIDSYYNPDWLQANDIDISPHVEHLEALLGLAG